MSKFKFIVSKPIKEGRSDDDIIRVHITSSFPTMYFRFVWDLSKDLEDSDKLRLAQLELKQEMIKELLNGDWEFEK